MASCSRTTPAWAQCSPRSCTGSPPNRLCWTAAFEVRERDGVTDTSAERGGLGRLKAWAARQREKADAADAEKATKKKVGRRGR